MCACLLGPSDSARLCHPGTKRSGRAVDTLRPSWGALDHASDTPNSPAPVPNWPLPHIRPSASESHIILLAPLLGIHCALRDLDSFLDPHSAKATGSNNKGSAHHLDDLEVIG